MFTVTYIKMYKKQVTAVMFTNLKDMGIHRAVLDN